MTAPLKLPDILLSLQKAGSNLPCRIPRTDVPWRSYPSQPASHPCLFPDITAFPAVRPAWFRRSGLPSYHIKPPHKRFTVLFYRNNLTFRNWILRKSVSLLGNHKFLTTRRYGNEFIIAENCFPRIVNIDSLRS